MNSSRVEITTPPDFLLAKSFLTFLLVVEISDFITSEPDRFFVVTFDGCELGYFHKEFSLISNLRDPIFTWLPVVISL
ncbi:hypothetical protein GIB67_032275 [Kingdonia uniflora]|uniref:Uncharacterized protein n=1 Tax=Kingdonia uniflora TaxID=39325 RepID=A0A7J7MXI8_9MAGN|nr:hypothetical protein GIB67_032275 [Kingdonia uniflora]